MLAENIMTSLPPNDPEITPSSFPKYSEHPLLAILPDHLKNPANYQKIRKAILETLATKCSHSEMIEMASCPKCEKMMLVRRKFLKKLGFISPAQYLLWQKTHEKIVEKFPLVDWEKENALRKAEANLKGE